MTIIIISLLLLTSLLPHLTFTAHVNVGIVNGTEAKAHSRPYMVSVWKNNKHNCGGFLISDQFVLTSAHCWKAKEQMTAVVGAHDLTKIKTSDHIGVKSYIQHPEYKVDTKNDIMLLKLEKKVQLNSNVRLIPLQKEGKEVGPDTACSVAGWGNLETNGRKSKVLMEADTTTINPAECERKWRDKFLAPKMICAHGAGGSCYADSGGPLVCGDTAVGVTAFSSKHECNALRKPNVYIKVSAYIKWILKEIGKIK